jgi:uncharacterized protein YdhG (YjbR/CyaY superfamily)
MAERHATVDDYIASFPPEVQQVLQQVRRTIHGAAPGLEEGMSYGIPTLRRSGRYLVYFAGWKSHVSVYPVPEGDEAFAREAEQYRSGKGTLKFPLAKPIPYDLITRQVELLAQAHAARGS